MRSWDSPRFFLVSKKWRIEKRRACRSAIQRYWQICDFPGDPDYLLSMIHKH